MGKIRKMLIDMDGVIFQGDSAIDGAHEALKYLKDKGIDYVLVTNATRMSVKNLIKKVESFGFVVDRSRFMNASIATMEYIKKKKPDAKCYVIIPDDMRQDFIDNAIDITTKEEPVDFVVFGYKMGVTFEELDIAFRLLLGGAELVAMHMDAIFPGEIKHISLGGFVKALEYASSVKATVIGKPSIKFFEIGMSKIDARAEETGMIGDGLRGDIVGAKNSGLAAILVKTGAYNENELKKSSIKPDYIIESVKELPNLIEKINDESD